ncbi:MAG: OmpA family protein [Bacteroidota bacterium]
MKFTTYIIIACAALLAGCGTSAPPTELVNARQAYQRASAGQAGQLVPAELHKAQMALAAAEESFKDDPKSFRTRDLAYVADRKAKMAEALATTAAGEATTAKAEKEYQSAQSEIVKNTKEDLAASTVRLAAEQTARLEAEKKAADAQAALAKLAAVKEEERGLVITLSGSVLFASNKSTLLPAAQDRLNQVTEALMATKERKLTVEGHTDSQGTSDYNQTLSQQRAEAVRSYIVSRGYPGDLILAQGIGEDRPVAENTNAEGRANNRRVEIIVNRSLTSNSK